LRLRRSAPRFIVSRATCSSSNPVRTPPRRRERRDVRRLRLKLLLPGFYLIAAQLAWLDFWRLPPDGLANVGLMLVVFPTALADLALRPDTAPEVSVLMPHGHGYVVDHALFFVPSVLLITSLLASLGWWIDRRRAKRVGLAGPKRR